MFLVYKCMYPQKQWFTRHFRRCTYSILTVANLLAHNNLWLAMLLCASKFNTAKIECSLEIGN